MNQDGLGTVFNTTNILRLLSGGTVFSALLYYVGRRYTEAYYASLDIPHDALRFNAADYMYQGFQSCMFLVAAGLTLIFASLLNLHLKRRRQPSLAYRPHKLSMGQIARQTIFWQEGHPYYFGIWFFFYLAMALAFVYFMFIPLNEKNLAAQSVTGILLAGSASWLAYNLLTHRPTVDFILSGRYLYWICFILVLLTVFASIQVLPNSIGTVLGIRHGTAGVAERTFPTVELTSKQPLGPADLKWVQRDDGSFDTEGQLLLIFESDTHLFLRQAKANAATFAIPVSNIVGMRFIMPGRWPPYPESFVK